MKMIPYGRQDISQDDIDAVVSVLRSDFLTQGSVVPAFEYAIAQYCGVEHAVAVNSATSALHIACLALGIQEGDIVWTSPITFVASANCAIYCGATVDFVDIDRNTINICITKLKEKLEVAEKIGRLPKLLIVVHFAGFSCDMEAIKHLSDKYGFLIIEDASHAVGARYLGHTVGSCYFSDITVFSFHPVKIITTGEGGVAVTKHENIATKMSLLRSHGITRDPIHMTHEPDGLWYYQQITLGYNYRMTELQAALGLEQLKRLDYYVTRRNIIANKYQSALSNLPINLPNLSGPNISSLHLYVIRLAEVYSLIDHNKIFEYMRIKGIGVNLHYIPVHLQPYYAKLGFKPGDFPEAEYYYGKAISLPIYPTLSDDEQLYVVDTLKEALH